MKPTYYDPDRMNAKVIGYCAGCDGGEIYENNGYLTHNGNKIHTDCVKDYAKDQITELTTKEVAEIFEMKKGE